MESPWQEAGGLIVGPCRNPPGMVITMNDAANYQARTGGRTQVKVELNQQQASIQRKALRLRGKVFSNLASVFRIIGIPRSLELPKQLLVWTLRCQKLIEPHEDMIVDASWKLLTSHGQMDADLVDLGCESFVVTLSEQLHILHPKQSQLDPLACKVWIHLPLKLMGLVKALRYTRVPYHHPLEWYAPGEINPHRTTPRVMARLFAPSNIYVMPDHRVAMQELQVQHTRLAELSRIRDSTIAPHQMQGSEAAITAALSSSQLTIAGLIASGDEQWKLIDAEAWSHAFASGISSEEKEELLEQAYEASTQQLFVRVGCDQELNDIEDECLAFGIPPADNRRMLQNAKSLVQKFEQIEEQAQPAAILAAAIAANIAANRV